MNKVEARSIVGEVLRKYRAKKYLDLKYLIDTQDAFEMTGESGVRYHLEVQAVWDSNPNGNLRVMVSIDDLRIHTFFPLTEEFIVSPAGQFIGE